MVREGFEMSERFGVPVLLRLVTRLSHSRTGVTPRPPVEQKPLRLPSDPKQFILLPSIARKRYKQLLADRPRFMEEANREDGHNRYIPHPGSQRGIIACGLAYNYLMENFPGGGPYHVLKVSFYPLPEEMIRRLFEDAGEIIVLEEGYPYAEEMLLGMPPREVPVIRGRLDGTLPRDGELNPWLVGRALGRDLPEPAVTPEVTVPRPPSFCPGCGHIDVYKALNIAMEKYGRGRVFSDIGCYTMGALPPYNAINSCVDMGASITMAVGAADAGLVPAVAVIGDSTFTHSGMTGLLDAVNKRSPVTIIISDNDATAMTGGQIPAGLGRIEQICLGLGVEKEHVRTIIPLRKHHGENLQVMEEELAHEGVSVIVARRECVRVAAAKKKIKR
jgi:indolepyruvate ferredoxin oxidoreductase alpha subunit